MHGTMAYLKVRLKDRVKIKAANIGLQYEGKSAVAKAIICVTTGEKFNSISQAVRKYGVGQSHLSGCLLGYYGCRTAGKHPETGEKLTWKYQ